MGWSLVSSQSFCSSRSLHVRSSPVLCSVISTQAFTGIGNFLGILWSPFPFSLQPSVRQFIASHFKALLSYFSRFVKIFFLSGPMTGFYLYFAITKREFSLGSWRERLIEVGLILLVTTSHN
jgi:hypothetical protein